MQTATAQPRARLSAGEHPARQVPIGAHVLYGARDVGTIVRIEEMVAVHPGMVTAVHDGFTKDILGLPILKFEIACSGGRTYYVTRFPHEPMQIVEV